MKPIKVAAKRSLKPPPKRMENVPAASAEKANVRGKEYLSPLSISFRSFKIWLKSIGSLCKVLESSLILSILFKSTLLDLTLFIKEYVLLSWQIETIIPVGVTKLSASSTPKE